VKNGKKNGRKLNKFILVWRS